VNDQNNQGRVYVLGHSAEELNRLIDQARLFGELTEDVFVRAGIGAGMRVLDVGCGAGDVSFLLARMVGPSGAVVGVDRSEDAVAMASSRAKAMGLSQVSFSQGEIEDISFDQPVDAAVGRFVLMYSPDPSVSLRRIATNVRAGGIVAFQEMNVAEAKSFPQVDVFEQSMRWIIETLDREKVKNLMGLGLYRSRTAAAADDHGCARRGQLRLSRLSDRCAGCEKFAAGNEKARHCQREGSPDRNTRPAFTGRRTLPRRSHRPATLGWRVDANPPGKGRLSALTWLVGGKQRINL
jgi:2-polyprenyl-3-methyl-5-hydroxy-6-metoxy-1,4-benzoquinol methylase